MLPDWIGEPYMLLHANYREEEVSLEEVVELLGKKRSTVISILSELEDRGFVYSDRGTYWIGSFQSYCKGLAKRQALGEDWNAFQLLQQLPSEEKPYLATGMYAASLYHRFSHLRPGRVRVWREDFPFWKALLRGTDAEPVPDLTQEDWERRNFVKGINVQELESLALNLIQKGTFAPIEGAMFMLVKPDVEVDWDRLVQLAEERNMEAELGFLLDAFNHASRRTKRTDFEFPQEVIEELHSGLEGRPGAPRKFPKYGGEGAYSDVAERWRIRSELEGSVIRKPLRDLAPFPEE